MFKFVKGIKKNRKGYTLTELIVVVAILGILAAVATPMIMGQIDKARTNTDAVNARTIESLYKIEIANGVTTSTAISNVKSNLIPFPTPQRSGYTFRLDTSNNTVSCTTSSIGVALP